MSTPQTAAGRAIDHQITVADLHDIGGRSAAGTYGAASPGPAVIGYQSAPTGAEGVILAVALHDSRRIVNVGFAIQGQCRTRRLQ